MANLYRKRKVTDRANERHFPFVVQISVPDGGFASTLDAINAWHCYSKTVQRHGMRQHIGDQELRRWCFESLEIAKAFRLRFGGEIVLMTGERRRESHNIPSSNAAKSWQREGPQRSDCDRRDRPLDGYGHHK
jgi:hypothetical protein